MAISNFGNSYAAQSLGMSPQATGAQDVAGILKNQLAQLAKRRGVKQTTQGAAGGPMSPAAFDLIGRQPLG